MAKSKPRKRSGERNKTYNGMNWIRQEKRLAIHLRDGLCCAYCGVAVEEGARLTLDHIVPVSKGGSNRQSNLITACEKCNKSRQDRTIADFSRAVAEYTRDRSEEGIGRHIANCRRRKLPLDEAKTLIQSRGSSSKAIEHIYKVANGIH